MLLWEKIKKGLSNRNKAIVLSVVLLIGIGAYFIFRPMPKTILAGEQVVLLINNIRSFYQNKPNAWGLNTYSAIQNKIVPTNMINGRQIKNCLNKDVLLGADAIGNTVMPGSKTFSIVYKNLDYDECVALSRFPFSEKVMISFDAVDVINEDTYSFSWGEEKALPISEKDAQSSCKQNNDILWNVYL